MRTSKVLLNRVCNASDFSNQGVHGEPGIVNLKRPTVKGVLS